MASFRVDSTHLKDIGLGAYAVESLAELWNAVRHLGFSLAEGALSGVGGFEGSEGVRASSSSTAA